MYLLLLAKLCLAAGLSGPHQAAEAGAGAGGRGLGAGARPCWRQTDLAVNIKPGNITITNPRNKIEIKCLADMTPNVDVSS